MSSANLKTFVRQINTDDFLRNHSTVHRFGPKEAGGIKFNCPRVKQHFELTRVLSDPTPFRVHAIVDLWPKKEVGVTSG